MPRGYHQARGLCFVLALVLVLDLRWLGFEEPAGRLEDRPCRREND
ncbi:MAG: hypothetical protein AB7O37_08010 [Vicinamibacteria bacterium]